MPQESPLIWYNWDHELNPDFFIQRQEDIYKRLTQKAKDKLIRDKNDGELLAINNSAENFSDDLINLIANAIDSGVGQALSADLETAIADIKNGINSYFHSTVAEWKTLQKNNYIQAYLKLNSFIEQIKKTGSVQINVKTLDQLSSDLNPENFRKHSFRLRSYLGKIAELESMLRMQVISESLVNQLIDSFGNKIPNLKISVEQDSRSSLIGNESFSGENIMVVRSEHNTLFSLKLGELLKSSIQNPKKSSRVKLIKSSIGNILQDKSEDYRAEIYNTLSYHWPEGARERLDPPDFVSGAALVRETFGAELLNQYYDTIYQEEFGDTINLVMHQGRLKTEAGIFKPYNKTNKMFNQATISGDDRRKWIDTKNDDDPYPRRRKSIFYWTYKRRGPAEAVLEVQRRIASFSLTYQAALGKIAAYG